MEEISGPVVGIALVPFGGFIRRLSFPVSLTAVSAIAVTIAISVILSAFNALTLSPALAALLLRPRTASGGFLKRLFGWFNSGFASATNAMLERAES